MGKLNGKVAVITGGNSGIGLATAKEFAREGARVAITGRDPQTLAAAEREIGGEILSVRADVGRLADIDKLYEAVAARFGRIDVLFVNAGLGIFKPFAEVTEEDFDLQMGVNLKGSYFTVQKAAPLLNNDASIILLTSINAHLGMPNSSIYAASKAAVLSLARTLSGELVGRGIRVNAISPGPIQTPMYDKLGLTPEQAASFSEGVKGQIPLGRFGRPEEVAHAALFLASSDSSFILGEEIVIDGGMSRL
ncbi:MAG: SDR family oxidoreductase [Pyrinomonadaceae bacterium]